MTRTWKDHYRDLNIPSQWQNISYGNDELPSFLCNGYQIWINAPTLNERKEWCDDEDWLFAVTYANEYGEQPADLLRTMDFDEVVSFVGSPDATESAGDAESMNGA
jgi:hypothetical protein